MTDDEYRQLTSDLDDALTLVGVVQAKLNRAWCADHGHAWGAWINGNTFGGQKASSRQCTRCLHSEREDGWKD